MQVGVGHSQIATSLAGSTPDLAMANYVVLGNWHRSEEMHISSFLHIELVSAKVGQDETEVV